MKKIFYFAFACALALGGASCSDDSSSEVNEWSAIYVGIERPKLGVSTLTLNINHPTAEVEAKASVPVTVKLSRPATQDITATLAMESDCEEAWTFETLEVVIPAGQITATTTLNGDWSYATDVVSSQTWTTKITVAAATPSNITRLSTNLNELTIVVNKEPVDLKNVSLETPSGNELTNRSSWTVTCNGAETDTLTDGDESSYMYVYNNLEVVVDLGKEVTVTGFKTTNQWGDAYAPDKVSIYTSSDGSSWSLQGSDIELPAAGDFDFAFGESVTCRYLRIYATGQNCLFSEIYIYGE